MTRTLSAPPQAESKGRAPVKGMVGRVLLSLVILSAVFAITYVLARPWISTWGATRAEATRTLPGDELVLDPTSTNTLAVTIDAPPERVWRWLVQMGVGRGGFYNFLFVENTLMRIGVHNADGIHPEWQDVEVGDHFWFTPKDYPGPRQGPEVVDIQKNRALKSCVRESRPKSVSAPGSLRLVSTIVEAHACCSGTRAVALQTWYSSRVSSS